MLKGMMNKVKAHATTAVFSGVAGATVMSVLKDSAVIEPVSTKLTKTLATGVVIAGVGVAIYKNKDKIANKLKDVAEQAKAQSQQTKTTTEETPKQEEQQQETAQPVQEETATEETTTNENTQEETNA